MRRDERRFPIQQSRLRSIPWAMIAPCEEQARRNHGGQSLETLAARAGLSAAEAVCVLEERDWKYGIDPIPNADEKLASLLEAYESITHISQPYVPTQDAVQAFGGSIWGGRKGEKRIDVTVVGNSIREVIEKLNEAVKGDTE